MLHENILKEAPHLNDELVTGYRTLGGKYYSAGEGYTWVNFCWECAAGFSEPLPHYSLFQAVLDTVHVTNFVQSHHCRWRTDSFTFALVVSSIFFDFRRLSSDLR